MGPPLLFSFYFSCNQGGFMNESITTAPSISLGSVQPITPLQNAQRKLYEIAGGSLNSGNVQAARLSTRQRMQYFRSAEFREWVASEKSAGRQVFWLKDVDKTQSAGDLFTFFFKWRADNKKFSAQQLQVITDFLLAMKTRWQRLTARATSKIWNIGRTFGVKANLPAHADLGPEAVIASWLAKEGGGIGMGMLDFWAGAYWPSQSGLTREEKLAQVQAFAPLYASKVYPGVREENQLLEEIGVNVVIVSNGDQELAIACAPYLGVKPENAVGSHLIYGTDGLATGVNHSYEVSGGDWHSKPQPGKPLSFHYWLHVNRARWNWDRIDERQFVIAGRDGDSGSTDGGMMILMQTAAIGNFMVNTPGEPKRIEQFYAIASKYGWTTGQFITLDQEASPSGYKPE